MIKPAKLNYDSDTFNMWPLPVTFNPSPYMSLRAFYIGMTDQGTGMFQLTNGRKVEFIIDHQYEYFSPYEISLT